MHYKKKDILLVFALLPAPAFAEAAGELTTTTATSSAENALTDQDNTSSRAEVTTGATTTSEETGSGVTATTNETDYPHKTLDQSVETLNNSFYKPKPRYGVDTNLNTMRRSSSATIVLRLVSTP